MFRLLTFFITLSVHVLRAPSRTREELLIESLALSQHVVTPKKDRVSPENACTRRTVVVMASVDEWKLHNFAQYSVKVVLTVSASREAVSG